jgi:uncharacterized protein involved in exopolysaccharide biosynthesis
MPVTVINVITAIGTGIATTVAGIKDMKERVNITKALSYLDNQQKADLNAELLKTQSIDKRIEILTNAVSIIRAKQSADILSNTITAKQQDKSRKETIMIIVILGGAIMIFAAIYFLKKK